MKRLLALLVAMGLLVAADRSYKLNARQDEKKEDKKEEKKKDEEKKDDKKEDKKVELTEDQKKELKAISGKFTVITFDRDGLKSPAAEIKKMSVEQDNEKWKFKLDDEVTEGTDVVYPDKKPKEVDSTYTNGTEAGKTVKGIYKIEGDSITFCWAETGKERPKEFSAKNKGLTMMVIKRVKEEKKKEEKKEKVEEKKKEKDE